MVTRYLSPFFILWGNHIMNNIKVKVTYNTPSEEAIKRFADKVMMIYNVSKGSKKGA